MNPQELKNSILQLAIQGKLVEQRHEEGTAEDLYQQIQAEKHKLIKAGKIKKEKPLPEISDNEIPFDIPESWKWVRLGDIYKLLMGQSPDGERVTESTYGIEFHQGKVFYGKDYLQRSNQVTDKPTKIAEPYSVLLCVRAPVGIVNITERRICIGRGLCAVSTYAKMDSKYVLYSLRSFKTDFIKKATGTTFVAITGDIVKKQVIPLPPLAEQKRIVDKIEELLPYIDRYEQAWSKLEYFNKRFPTDLQKSILQMAIQGKLVEQRPEEGTGEDLYQQIQAEKQKLIKAGKIKKEKPLPEISDDEKPFDIPESWKWVRLSNICKSIADGDHQAPPQAPNGVPFLVISNLSSGVIDFSTTRYVEQKYFENLSPERVAERGDLIFTVTGSYGIPVKVDCDIRFCFQRHMALLKPLIDNEYFFCLLKSSAVKEQCNNVATGTAQKTVGLLSLRNITVPLPPLAEQKRIVAKLEEMLPLCEKLK